MLFIGRLFREFEAQQSDHGTGGIGQIVQAVCQHRHGVRPCAHGNFTACQKQIADNPHKSCQFSRTGTLGLVVLVHEMKYLRDV